TASREKRGLPGLAAMPDDVGLAIVFGTGTDEEFTPSQGRMPSAQSNHLANKTQEISILGRKAPVHPADLVVLAPGVVIATLRSQEFVAGQQHRHALGEKQCRDEVLRVTTTQA